jgi:two-component system, OmpR family, phosphate regulon sensor histidine kinase PhoR
MSNRTIQYVIALAAISIIGIITTQIYWVRQAFDLRESQFNQSSHHALKSVAEKIAVINQAELPPNPVKQVNSDYYVVSINGAIDANVLEYYLKTEFDRHDLHMDYEYGIYDCASDKIVYGNYISANQSKIKFNKPSGSLPKWEEYPYYFGIRFPTKSRYLALQMDLWIFSSALLVIVIGFFAYTLSVILKQKRLSQIQRDFINNMTHEFKTPIATIGVSVDLITNPKVLAQPEKVSNYAEIIKTQNTRLKNQIEKVLQMALMDKGKLKLNLEWMDLPFLLQEAVSNFNLKTDTNISLECKLHKGNAWVLADKVHFTNIIYNLLDNAVKYTEATPEIKVKAVATKNHIQLSIQDNGIGIAREHQRKIFDKFFRVPTGNVHNVKGFGLGLNYVKLIVRAHNWKIDLQSELGQGSTFTITMPVQKNPAALKNNTKAINLPENKGDFVKV